MFSAESNTSQKEEALRDFKRIIAVMRQEDALFSSQHFIDALVGLRAPKPVPRWKILMKQVFEKADVDKCGTLTKEEFTNALQAPSTQARLESMGIDPEIVEEMFDIIDVDGSDDVTEAEMMRGIELMLQLQGESDDFDIEELREKMPPRHQHHHPYHSHQQDYEHHIDPHPQLQLTKKVTLDVRNDRNDDTSPRERNEARAWRI